MASRPNNSDADFNTKLLSIILCLFGTIVPNATPPLVLPTASTRLGISAANMTALWNLFYGWSDFYPKSLIPTTRGHAIINDKNDTRTAIEILWSLIVNDMIKSALTNDDRVSLYLPKRDAERTDTPTMDKGPNMIFEPSVHGVHSFRFVNPDDPETLALPEGQSIFLEKFVGAANLADDAVPFNQTEIVTRHLFDLQLQESDTGKTAYYCPTYITKTGKKGVRGRVFSAVIS
jgi:hypothetical protein